MVRKRHEVRNPIATKKIANQSLLSASRLGWPNDRLSIAGGGNAGDHASVRISFETLAPGRLSSGVLRGRPGRSRTAGLLVGNRERNPRVPAPGGRGIALAAFAPGARD